MKLTTLSFLLGSTAFASPLGKRATTGYKSGNTANDVTNGVCAPLTGKYWSTAPLSEI